MDKVRKEAKRDLIIALVLLAAVSMLLTLCLYQSCVVGPPEERYLESINRQQRAFTIHPNDAITEEVVDIENDAGWNAKVRSLIDAGVYPLEGDASPPAFYFKF